MTPSIFVSKPNSLSQSQAEFCEIFFSFLINRGFTPRTLGQTDFPNNSPINAVRSVLSECSGAIVLGLRQTFIEKGFHKVATEDQTPLVDCYLPTPWNQIEAGMAFMDNLPMLIVKEAGVAGGVFNVGSTDKFIHQAELTPEYLASQRFLQPFNSWQQEVTLLAHSRSHVKAN